MVNLANTVHQGWLIMGSVEQRRLLLKELIPIAQGNGTAKVCESMFIFVQKFFDLCLFFIVCVFHVPLDDPVHVFKICCIKISLCFNPVVYKLFELIHGIMLHDTWILHSRTELSYPNTVRVLWVLEVKDASRSVCELRSRLVHVHLTSC